MADNQNMTVLVLMDQNSEHYPSLVNEQLLKIYGLITSVFPEDNHYFCVYSGKKVRSSVSESSLSSEFVAKTEKT